MQQLEDSLFARLEEQRALPDGRIRLVDGGRLSPALTPLQSEILLAQEEPKLRALGLRLEHSPLGDGTETRIKSGAYVGAARFVLGRNALDVIVEPKVGLAPLFRMLDLVGRHLPVGAERLDLGQESGELPEIWINYVIGKLERFVRKHYFRDYVDVVQHDMPTVQGRLLAEHYLRENVPRLRLHRVSCQFFDYSQDILENRVLLAAATCIGRLIGFIPKSRRNGYARRLSVLRSMLADVSDVPVSVREVEAIRYNRRNEHFREIHELCASILSSSSVSLHPGRRLSFAAFGVNMNHLFEGYVRRLAEVAFSQRAISGRQRRFDLHDLGTHLNVDVIIRLREGTVIGDCKNKDVYQSDDLGFDIEAVNLRDLYQVVAYAAHHEIKAKAVFLVYPVVSETLPAVSLARKVRSFSGAGGSRLPVSIFLINLKSSFPEQVRAWTAIAPEGFHLQATS